MKSCTLPQRESKGGGAAEIVLVSSGFFAGVAGSYTVDLVFTLLAFALISTFCQVAFPLTCIHCQQQRFKFDALHRAATTAEGEYTILCIIFQSKIYLTF
jgi:hypothetical protein